MVCIQCYLPPILFMLYMKFINPIVAPIIAPTIGRIVSYFRGPQAAVQSDACPYRPPRKTKKVPEKEPDTCGDPSSSASSEEVASETSSRNKQD